MGTFTRIDTYSLHNLNSAEYANFIDRFLALLPLAPDPDRPGILSDDSPLGAPLLNIPSYMVTRTKELLEKLTDLNKQTRSNAGTEQIAETEHSRDIVASFITDRVFRYSTLPLESERGAGKLLYNTLKVYAGIAQLPVNQETLTIKGMLLDLRKPEFTEAVKTLGLQPYMDELERLNNLYEEQVGQRSAARSLGSVEENSKEIRLQMNNLYEDMTDLAFASNLLKETDKTAAFIRDVNNLIAETRTARNLRGSKPKKDDPGSSDRPGILNA